MEPILADFWVFKELLAHDGLFGLTDMLLLYFSCMLMLTPFELKKVDCSLISSQVEAKISEAFASH